jgi:DNA-binding response OmpR family regulator
VGSSCSRRCARILWTRDIPVVLLSARAGEEATLKGLAAGADEYLVKRSRRATCSRASRRR